MSVLIRGAKMPKNCLECLSTLGLFSETCPISDDSNIDVEFVRNHIYDGCPLVEIPPHGRLIDANKLVRYMEERQERLNDDEALWELSVVDTFLSDAPTVIESEGK